MPRNAMFVTPRTTTLFEIRRKFSIAPTAITFFALAGDAIESGLPLPLATYLRCENRVHAMRQLVEAASTQGIDEVQIPILTRTVKPEPPGSAGDE